MDQKTRKAVLRVFELASKQHASREMAIAATADTLCMAVSTVREALEPQKESTQ